jgi:hypothetical protein
MDVLPHPGGGSYTPPYEVAQASSYEPPRAYSPECVEEFSEVGTRDSRTAPPRCARVSHARRSPKQRDLLVGLERRLKERDRSDLEEHLGHLERLAGSLPEAHTVRLLADSAVRSAKTRGAGYAYSAASRSRSKTEGRLSTLRGSLSRLEAFAGMDA